MSEFVKSSFWNLFGNVFARTLSFITIPFVANYYAKSDIAVYRSLQSLLLLIFAIIPMGINLLYLSEGKKTRNKYWNLLILSTSLFGFLFLGVLFFVRNKYFSGVPWGLPIFVLISILEIYKVILITGLMADVKFKQITIAMISRQTILNTLLISFAFINGVLPILIGALLIAEFTEILILNKFTQKSKKTLNRPILENTCFDNKARKYMLLTGGESLLVNLALQLPNIIVLLIMGKEIAVEFQMPLVLAAVPAVMIMKSVASVMLPYLSNNRDNDKIHNVINHIHYIFIIMGLPIYFAISFFAHEISDIMFNPNWEYAYIGLRYFPIFMTVNILQSPLSGLALLKNRPEIGFIYALSLLVFRLLSLKLGYQYYGFIGAILSFTISDSIIRTIRLLADLKLVNYNFHLFIKNVAKPTILALAAMISCSALYYFDFNKYLGFFISWVIFGAIFIIWDKRRLASQLQQLKVSFKR